MNKETVMNESDNTATTPAKAPPWWHFRIVWFVLGLPAAVVLASLYTATLAWRHMDPVVVDARQVSAEGAADPVRVGNALEPAERARNHAATPGR